MLPRIAAFLLLLVAPAAAQIPQPKDYFGFTPGDDYQLANFEQIAGYFQKLDVASGRLKLVEFGKTSEGRPMYAAFISSEENLKRLDEFKEVNRKLALGLVSQEEARKLADAGKAFVWIDSGLHATEVAPAQHAPLLAYRMLTDESEEARRIRDKVILIQIPVINPDGLDMVAAWYRKNVGTPYELSPLPELFQKYAGHDNNRDWFMLNLRETRNVTRLLYKEWFPQIVYNQHQQPAFPARIFVPPYAEPLNPNIPAPVMEGINLIGAAIKERFAREHKTGVISYFGFDAWWDGGLRSVPAFHNMHGILTETAASGYATPRTYDAKDFPAAFANGIPTREPSMFYEQPWMGGDWRLRDAIDYMLTADFAILDLASTRTSQFLYKAWEIAHANIESGERGNPYAYIVPAGQWDPSSAQEMLWRLQAGGIAIERARADFEVAGKKYAKGSWVIPAAQPFRGYLLDLLEPQKYPEIRTGTSGPTKRPYDIAGWTLSLQMGVQVDRAEDKFQADLEDTGPLAEPEPRLAAREDIAFLALARLLKQGKTVRRGADGEFLVDGSAPAGQFRAASWELKAPRVGLYHPKSADIDEGWLEWLFDRYEVPYELLSNDEVRTGNLAERFDVVVLAGESPQNILHGWRAGVPTSRGRRGGDTTELKTLPRPDQTGGIGIAGLYQLERFAQDGGVLISIGRSVPLVVDNFELGIRIAARGGSGQNASAFYSPGSLLRIRVDNRHPFGLGMPADAVAMVDGGEAFEIEFAPGYNQGERQTNTVASYAGSNLLASGWVSGESAVLGRPAVVEARYGKGRVVLFGFNPDFRGQTFGTFKLLLNAIYMGPAKSLDH